MAGLLGDFINEVFGQAGLPKPAEVRTYTASVHGESALEMEGKVLEEARRIFGPGPRLAVSTAYAVVLSSNPGKGTYWAGMTVIATGPLATGRHHKEEGTGRCESER